MKRLLLIILIFITVNAQSQQPPLQVQAKRGVFTECLFINGQWVNRIFTNLNSADSVDESALATGKAIVEFIKARAGNIIQNQASTAQFANIWMQGTGVLGSHNGFKSTLINERLVQLYVT